jgi:hypothetical protein
LERATELRGLVLAGELFVERPLIVVAGEETAAIAVEGDRDAVAAQEAIRIQRTVRWPPLSMARLAIPLATRRSAMVWLVRASFTMSP